MTSGGTLRRGFAWLAAGIFGFVRAVTLTWTLVLASMRHKKAAILAKADGQWYLHIARFGYHAQRPYGPHGVHHPLATLAFFPLYPLSIRMVEHLGVGGIDAGIAISVVSGLVAAWCVAHWAEPNLGVVGAVVLVTLWAMMPSTEVFTMVYSDGLFIAASAAAILALQRRQFLWGGLTASVAGLTRPSGLAVVLAVVIAATLEGVRRRGLRREVVVGALLAPLGSIVAFVHVSLAVHRLSGWFWVESTIWHSGSDWGQSTLNLLSNVATNDIAQDVLPKTVSAVVVVVMTVLFAWWGLRHPRPSAPDTAYTAAVVFQAVTQHGYEHVKPRLLLGAWQPLSPVAALLSRARQPVLIAAGVPLLVASAAWNAYLIVGWRGSV